jgi:serine/threonine-protein kinase
MTTFGRYEILEKLGEGAMGVVYRARNNSLGRIEAIKMLAAEMGGEEELHQRFRREAEAIGRLNHPNIVSVYDLGEEGGQLYMAMELLEGDDVRILVESQADIPLADRVRILAQICDGLGYAHGRGVVHRDIKPANILITTGANAKILDFGLARVATRATITKRGVILGTPDYMSPEQAMGQPIDHRSDIFSAGAVFYEFLTYQKPFRGKTLHSVLYQIISDSPDPVLTVAPDLPARLAAVVHRMMEKDPARRFESMEEIARRLRAIHASLRRQAGRGIEAPKSAEELRGRVREHLGKGRAHLDAGRTGPGLEEMNAALALDPDCDEAIEVVWRTHRALRAARKAAQPRSPADMARIDALLTRVGTSGEEEARGVLAELVLIAPDDPRVVDLMRERQLGPRGSGAVKRVDKVQGGA